MDEQKKAMHLAFWAGEKTKRPLYGFSLGSYFPAKRYKAAANILNEGLHITPELLRVSDYMADYERMYQETLSVKQDLTLVASPYTGIPWMEAILGCDLIGGNSSIVAEPMNADWSEIKPIIFDPENPWVQKYMEFFGALIELSAGRFPVGQPILRGPSDMMSCIRGHQQYAIDFLMYPEESMVLQDQVTNMYIQFIKHQQKMLMDFPGGTGFGFYSLWCPGETIWFQEDASALLSPKIYAQYLKQADSKLTKVYPYNLIHLHPASLFALDEILTIASLKVIQINKDVGGPAVSELIPHFKKVVEGGKRLVVWGDLTLAEVQEITYQVPLRGVCLHIVAEQIETAMEISEWLQRR
ncbi:MAG: hypothetical protein SCK28_14220 [Bacillota bacterium]|nr:hypothetical protein [Bacillota bacterium]